MAHDCFGRNTAHGWFGRPTENCAVLAAATYAATGDSCSLYVIDSNLGYASVSCVAVWHTHGS